MTQYRMVALDHLWADLWAVLPPWSFVGPALLFLVFVLLGAALLLAPFVALMGGARSQDGCANPTQEEHGV